MHVSINPCTLVCIISCISLSAGMWHKQWPCVLCTCDTSRILVDSMSSFFFNVAKSTEIYIWPNRNKIFSNKKATLCFCFLTQISLEQSVSIKFIASHWELEYILLLGPHTNIIYITVAFHISNAILIIFCDIFLNISRQWECFNVS